MLAKIHLTRYAPDSPPDNQRGWPMIVRARGENIDPEIFVYHRMRATDPYEGDMFEAITSVNQFHEIPAYAPGVVGDEVIPYYRRNQMEIFARTPAELDEIWKYLVLDVSKFVRDYNSESLMVEHSSAEIDSDGAVVEINSADRSYLLQLSWAPAGNWTGTTIIPDTSKRGWLPMSQLPIVLPGAVAPEGVKWFYNIKAEDGDFQELYSLVSEPYFEVLLDVDGIQLLYGPEGAYVLTSDTVYWMPNDNYQIEMVSKNPWPDDYIDGDEVNRSMRLTVPVRI